MKKQRILALTLAATTAMSMFAGMSVFAEADPNDGFHGYTPASDVSDWTADVVAKISTENYGDVSSFSTETVYLFDYKENTTTNVDPNKETLANVKSLVDLAQWDPSDANVNAAIAALDKFYGTDPALDNSVDTSAMTSDRRSMLADYVTQYNRAKDLKSDWAAFTESDPGDYLWDDLDYFNVNAMRTAFNTLTSGNNPYAVSGKTNSQLVHLTFEGKRIMDNLSVTTTTEEKYNALLEEIQALEESDYSASNYKTIVRAIEDAEDLAAEGKYSDAIKKLNTAKGVNTITPKYADLTAALKGLFTNNTIPSTVTFYAGTAATNCAYLKADYDDVDAWEAFAGNDKAVNADDYVKGAYREALEVYRACLNPTTRKTTGQSKVDAAKENLDAALLALNPNYSTPNWLTVKMEEALEKADKVVEDDYRTNTTAYKNFIKAKEALEKLLENGAVKESAGEAAITALTTAQNKLSSVKKAVPSATSSELNALKKEATTLLKKTEGKTLTQVTSLQDAKAAADKINSSKTISEYEAAIDALKAAIANYNQLQGWYQENGVWYYGQGNGKATGWLHLGSDWYWLNQTTGAMSANKWEQINGAWYYFYGSGKMVAGKWHQVNGAWYSFTNSGAMRTGWFKSPDNDNWYYLDGSGKMVANGWYKINGKDYYFYANGSMAANTTIGGYRVGADGAWIK